LYIPLFSIKVFDRGPTENHNPGYDFLQQLGEENEFGTLSATKSEALFGEPRAVMIAGAPRTMGQEISVSYQAVKSKVYRLIDGLVENAKTQDDVQESMKRWWKLIHPADRPIARKYLLTVLTKSNATLEAICEGLIDLKDFETEAQSLPRLHALPDEPASHRLKASM
jgi:hypothetical protein